MTGTAVRGRSRLALAGLLCVAPMGSIWSFSPGFTGASIAIDPVCDNGCVSTYLPGISYPPSTVLVSESPLRVFLVGALVAIIALALRTAGAGTRVSSASSDRATAGVAIGVLLAGTALAAQRGVTVAVTCQLAALALVWPSFGANRGPRVQ